MVQIPAIFAAATQHHRSGRLNSAEALYHEVVEADPTHNSALHLLGVIAHQKGQYELAVERIQRAISLKNDVAEYHNNLGETLLALRHIDEAIECYRRAVSLKPKCVSMQCNLGVALREQGRLNESLECYRNALEVEPGNADAHNNQGNVLKGMGRLSEAEACYQRALELKPVFAEAHLNLGVLNWFRGDFDKAAVCYQRALDLKPDSPSILIALVHVQQHLCEWKDLMSLSRQVIEHTENGHLRKTGSPVSPFNFLSLPLPTTAHQQLICAQRWAASKIISGTADRWAQKRSSLSKPKIIVGYLAATFHAHAMAGLISEFLEKHDRRRFEVIGYSYGPDDGSPDRKRICKAFDRFVDVKNLSFSETATCIAEDCVDILIDLMGHTKDARMEILSLRPAPIQVNYLGYPGTMGANFIDYILVDDFVAPSEQQPYFSEKPVQLPGCYFANDSQREIAINSPTRIASGLPVEGFVFCSFNNNYKISPMMFDLWMDLLKQVPKSVLWLLEGNAFVSGNLKQEAVIRGVAADRLIFAPRASLPKHLARHRLADLFLDTYPVNAHTTASDSLWAGLPLITLAGKTMASRVAGSMLRTIGVPELITTSFEDYHALALRLARNREMLRDVRSRIEANRKTSSLFSGEQFARNVEKAYTIMWDLHRNGQKPRAITVPA